MSRSIRTCHQIADGGIYIQRFITAPMDAGRVRRRRWGARGTREGAGSGIGACTGCPPARPTPAVTGFDTKLWKTRERKPEAEVIEIAAPPIIDMVEFETVPTLLKSRSPVLAAPRIVSVRPGEVR
jgi:hypothetical protein